MKIRFLGTSHGVPTPGRHCQSVLVETEKGDYLFDAGAPVMDLLIHSGYDPSRLRAVFISHCHPDHFFGLVHMLDLSSWYYYKVMEYSVFMPEQRGIDMLREFCGKIHRLSDRVTYRLVEEGTFYRDGNVTVTAVHTDHMRSSTDISFGFLIQGEGQRIYITGDLHPSLEDFPTELLRQGVDALVTECAHFSPKELFEKLQEISAQRIFVIHVHPSERYGELKAQEGEYPRLSVCYPEDGDIFSL